MKYIKIVILVLLLLIGVRTAGAISAFDIKWGTDLNSNQRSNTLKQWVESMDAKSSGGTDDTGGTVYYVDNNSGSDSSDGKSWEEAFLTISCALAASHADIATSPNFANRNRIYVKGDDFDEDLTKLAQKTDIIGVGSDDGSKRPRLLGEHVIQAATTGAEYMGCRFINMYFQAQTGDTYVFDIPTGHNGIEFIGCRFDAFGSGTAYGIRNTTAHDMRIIGCVFNRQAIGNEGFTTAAISISTGSIYFLDIIGNTIDSGIGIVINTSTIPTGGQISNNTIFAATLTIDDNSNKFYITNNTLISDTTYGSGAFDFDETFAANNTLTCSNGTYTIPGDDSVTVMSTAAIEADLLNLLISAADGGGNKYPDSVVAQSILAFLMDSAADPATTNYDNTKHSLKAIGADTDTIIANLGTSYYGTATGTTGVGSTTDSSFTAYDDEYFNTGWVLVVLQDAGGGQAAPEGEIAIITEYDKSTGVFTHGNLTAATDTDDLFLIARREGFLTDSIALKEPPAAHSLSTFIAGTTTHGTPMGSGKSIADALGTDGVAVTDGTVSVLGAIGANSADNSYVSSAVVSNADGSVLERMEDLLDDTTLILADTGTAGVVIVNNGITAGKIATDAITNDEMADDAIDAGTMAANAIGASELAADAVVEITTSVAQELNHGAVYYVDSDNGSNSNDGLTWATAELTIAAGIANCSDGDTVYIRGVTSFQEDVDTDITMDNIKLIGVNKGKRRPNWLSTATGTSQLTLNSLDWEISNLRFSGAANTVALIRVVYDGTDVGAGSVIRDCYFAGGASHAAIEYYGGGFQNDIINNHFAEFSLANAANEATIYSTHHDNYFIHGKIIDNWFTDCLDHINLHARTTLIKGNTFQQTGGTIDATNILVLTVDAGSGGNTVTGNTFEDYSWDLTPANGYSSQSSDNWSGNYCLDGISSGFGGAAAQTLVPGRTYSFARASLVNATTVNLWDISGGPIEVISFWGMCTTDIGTSGTIEIFLDSDGTDDYGLSTAVSCDAVANGDRISFDATHGESVLTIDTGDAAGAANAMLPWFVDEGMLETTVGTGTTGGITWYMTFRPLTTGVSVTVQ